MVRRTYKMSLWNNISAGSGQDYLGSVNKTQEGINKLSDLQGQYTGNAGYSNALQQGLTGANITAANAGKQATDAARNAGMNKARAAQLGAEQGASSYGNNLAAQQSMANQSGLSALNAQGNIIGNQMNLAGMQQAEKQNVFNRGNANLDRLAGIVGNIGGGLASALSDERMKDIQDRTDSLSKLIENIDLYDYKYTDEAQKEYPGETDDKEKVGVMAQELEANPVTASSVKEDENGIKHVDTKQLSLQAIGLISDLSKRISELEGDKE